MLTTIGFEDWLENFNQGWDILLAKLCKHVVRNKNMKKTEILYCIFCVKTCKERDKKVMLLQKSLCFPQ